VDLLLNADVFSEELLTENEAEKLMEDFVTTVTQMKTSDIEGLVEHKRLSQQLIESNSARPSSGVLDMIRPSR
jgi:hypothetical protein